MPRGSGFNIIGIARTSTRLRAIGSAVGAGGSDNVAQAAEELRTEIQARAPVDTGRLRDSYTVRVAGGNTAYVETDVEYAIHQEFGTQYQSGTPHVRPAVEANRGRLARMMGEGTLRAAIHG